jgi:long-chain acyl-CoA synthetase
MNKRKYIHQEYQVPEIRDLRELLHLGCTNHKDWPSYLVKDVPGGEYRPIPFWRLGEDVDSIGTELFSMGLGKKKIALLGENSYNWVVTYLATTNGGGVIVPLDKELSRKELLHLIQRSGVTAIAYGDKFGDLVQGMKAEAPDLIHFINMDVSNDGRVLDSLSWEALRHAGKEKLDRGNTDFLDAEIDPEAMCALLFTSGTTGMAKGVMLSHKNIASNVYNMSKYVHIKEPGIGLSVLPMHHSYEMTCHILTAIYQGVCVAVCEGLKHIAKNLVESQTTVMLGVPLVFEGTHKKVFKQAASSGKDKSLKKGIALSKKLKLYNRGSITHKIFKDVHNATGGHIDLFIAGGAAMNARVLEDFQAMGFPMIQGYGMTENSPIIAVNKDRFSKAESVGFPMPGTEVKIIDQDAKGVGEILCKGPSVMLGYYENPEETAKVLKDGWLHTGDYGYFDSEGFLYISGRKKSVIVTKNGKNIFPEELEYYLMESDYIEEALVYGEVDKQGDAVVKAIIYPNFESIDENLENYDDKGLNDFLKKVIDDINEEMALYKRVKRFAVRKTEFEKTTTKKIKRFSPENFQSDC